MVVRMLTPCSVPATHAQEEAATGGHVLVGAILVGYVASHDAIGEVEYLEEQAHVVVQLQGHIAI